MTKSIFFILVGIALGTTADAQKLDVHFKGLSKKGFVEGLKVQSLSAKRAASGGGKAAAIGKSTNLTVHVSDVSWYEGGSFVNSNNYTVHVTSASKASR